MLREVRRLPGIRFEVQSPPLRETLPRMDVALFVGFAASGPLHLPVVIEAVAQFEVIFGHDLPLAWDSERGEQVYAYLAPTVRAFFRNGGRRCYIIRVANRETARPNLFPISGVARVKVGINGIVTGIEPAFAQARSAGSWSDGLRIGTASLIRSVIVETVESDAAELALTINGRVAPGDVLRLRYRGTKNHTPLVTMLAVRSVQDENAIKNSPLSARPGFLHVKGTPVYFETLVETSPPESVNQVWIYTRLPEGQSVAASSLMTDQEGITSLYLAMSLADAPSVGAFLRIDADHGTIWLVIQNVQDADVDELSNLSEKRAVRVTGVGLRWLENAPPLPVELPVAEVMQLELLAREGDGDPISLSSLDFAPDGLRYWGYLPDDFTLFTESSEHVSDDLWRSASNPRFPLASLQEDDNIFTIPLSIDTVFESFLPPLIPAETALFRDGLAIFGHKLFLDPSLVDSVANNLITKADYIRYQSPNPRPYLDGIHGALAIDEVTLIAIPDAVHSGWELVESEAALNADVLSPPDADKAEMPNGNFQDCRIKVLKQPILVASQADNAGTFTLTFTADEVGGIYTLEEAVEPNFEDAVTVYHGKDEQLTLYGRSRGVYYYRVQVESGINLSDWSISESVAVGASSSYRLRIPDAKQLNFVLLSLQRALLRMCAGRGDLFAVLSLTDGSREDSAIEHANALSPADNPISPPPDHGILDNPLSYGESGVLSYGALYHPWLINREETTQVLSRTPPDGAICGMMAQRALTRGAWIAPANQALSGIVSLIPSIHRERWLDLLEAQVNVITSQPYGFVTLSADTLTDDPDLIPIGTRRLLILLRRLALRLGMKYIFEPNDDVFQRMVHRGFEGLLDNLFARGAFAGRSARNAYQVVVHNAPQDYEQGRLIVDLKVAPARPMVFLTVRLIQSGERGLLVNEVH